jgi:hypothetical protein
VRQSLDAIKCSQQSNPIIFVCFSLSKVTDNSVQRSQSQDEINPDQSTFRSTHRQSITPNLSGSSTASFGRLDDQSQSLSGVMPINPLLNDQQLRLQHQLLQLKQQQQLQQQLLLQQFQQQQQQLLDQHEKQLQDRIRCYLSCAPSSNVGHTSNANQSNTSRPMTIDEELRNSSTSSSISSELNAASRANSSSYGLTSSVSPLPAPSTVPKSKESSGIASSAVRQRLQEFVLNKKQRELRQMALVANSSNFSPGQVGSQAGGMHPNSPNLGWNPALHKFDNDLMPLRKTGE